MNDLIEVKIIPPPSKKGKGVFAKQRIKEDIIIEMAHVILIPNKEYELIQDTILWNYFFEWDDPKYDGEYQAAIALSICQFINHSFKPNLRYEYDYSNIAIKYITIRDVEKGEELTVNYNGVVGDQSPVWFEVE
ncbi:MAG: SET domain-containing protein-lysine N-methyltransferase [Candidatus Hodarchaeota archaeon]